MIEVKGISKTYGKKKMVFQALKDVSFKIPNGASVAIVGKSGSGKSTLMHAMSGLGKPQTGKILVDGINILEAHDLLQIYRCSHTTILLRRTSE